MRLGRRAAIALAVLLGLGPVAAQTDPTITAQRASAMLEDAADALVLADGARDRVAALSETIRAFEEGLSAIREALRRSSAREAAILADLAVERDRLAALLAAAQSLEQAAPPLPFMHPDGPEAAVRSAMILSEITPALATETARLRDQTVELQAMRALQEQANHDVAAALAGVQAARAELSEAIADRTDLPPRLEQDAARMRAILDAATSLGALSEALAADPLGPLPEAQRIDTARGTLELPAFGRVLRGFGAADAAGVERPGLILATRAQALVTAPWTGTVRYAGAVPGDGLVVLLEPDGDHLIILAGLGEIFVASGEILGRGAPLGLMGQTRAASEELMGQPTEGAGLSLSETLYIEIRVENEPVDPALWFGVTRDED